MMRGHHTGNHNKAGNRHNKMAAQLHVPRETVHGVPGSQKACNIAAIAFLICAGALCVAPVLWIVGGVFLDGGSLSFEPVRMAFAHGGRALLLLRNSLGVAGVALGVSALLGVPLGFFTFRTDLPGRKIILVSLLLAACLPLHVVTGAWIAVFGLSSRLSSVIGAGWVMGIAYVPFFAAVTGVCFVAVDPILEEQALLDAGRWRVFARVTVPLGAWGVAMAGVFVLVFALSLITVTDILMVRTFAEEVLTQWSLGAGPKRAAAVSLPAIGLLLVILAGSACVLRRYSGASVWGAGAVPMRFRLGRAKAPIAVLVWLLFFAFLIAPLLFLMTRVGGARPLVSAYRTAAPELWTSVWLGGISATLCATIALPAAWALDQCRRGRYIIAVGVVLLLATPAPLVGAGIVAIFNRGGLLGHIYDSPLVVIFAYVVRVVPFAVLVTLPSVRRIPSEIEDAAVVDGCNWLRRMTHVVFPMSWRGVLLAWLVSFVLSLAETGASFLVMPPGRTTLPIRSLSLLHYGLYSEQAGICLVLLGIVLLPAALLAMLLWRMLSERFC
ncbi:MAG: iron ABC transporter permease [Planctomycetes bacterium]|nr:iron ABC transporter permease [Planctomycetota bacterium]